MPNEDRGGVTIVYDGQCPFCASYVRLVRLRESVGEVRLVDARSDHPRVARARAEGHDLDRGMIVDYGGATYHGDQAMHVLALLSTGSGPVAALSRRAFRSPRAARLIYPVLVAGRGLALRLLGRRPIAEGAAADGTRGE